MISIREAMITARSLTRTTIGSCRFAHPCWPSQSSASSEDDPDPERRSSPKFLCRYEIPEKFEPTDRRVTMCDVQRGDGAVYPTALRRHAAKVQLATFRSCDGTFLPEWSFGRINRLLLPNRLFADRSKQAQA